MNKYKKIKYIYNISFDLSTVSEENACQMNKWYNNLINKNYHQLNLFDVTRLIIQNMFLELAVPKAWIFINKNPFCGQRYEGELLELLSKLDVSYLEKYKESLKQILFRASIENKTYNWLCKEEREEFQEIIDNFLIKLKNFV